MSGSVSPVVLLQMLQHYHNYTTEPRIFKFTRNNRMRIHKETPDEASRRKSIVSKDIRDSASRILKEQLIHALKGRIDGKVWIDPETKKLAVPQSVTAGNSGVDILTTGSHMTIPEGKIIRVFTYWEKVNDIDLSGFALDEEGNQMEFSWRTFGRGAWNKNRSTAYPILFSGDETSGYNGGSEYFDIGIEAFMDVYPGFRYLIFCDNVYSNLTFNNCFCKAGFMIRKEPMNGEIFEPKTVQTSFRIDSDSTYCYLFAIDLLKREMIWLNVNRNGNYHVAGESQMAWLKGYFEMPEVFSVHDLYTAAATQITDDPKQADVLVLGMEQSLRGFGTDNGSHREQTTVKAWDVEKMFQLLQ